MKFISTVTEIDPECNTCTMYLCRSDHGLGTWDVIKLRMCSGTSPLSSRAYPSHSVHEILETSEFQNVYDMHP